MEEKFVGVIAFKEEDCIYNTEVSTEFFTRQEAVDFIASKQGEKYFDFGVVETRLRKAEKQPVPVEKEEEDMSNLNKAIHTWMEKPSSGKVF